MAAVSIDRPDAIPSEYQEAIDEALHLVYSQHLRSASRLDRRPLDKADIAELRNSPLGSDLVRLARIAIGHERAGQDEVRGAIDAVLQLLFWPAATDRYTVPRSFWDQPLGVMLSRAKFTAYPRGELITIGQAARALGVTRTTIYRRMDEGDLDFVRDDLSGRTFLVRHEVETWREDPEAGAAGSE